ncbi:MAG: metal ABC transporter substrate-binding protein [Ignavibacteriaceae bacterium]|jgi:zinc transport system substrate-binding protein|nr:metal ABC transporter substrate-binding protein [Ignavibacteriaceae bacterium]
MKRFVFILLLLLIVSGCSKQEHKSEIVTTIYPFKAIIQELTGERFSVKAILPAGADPHTYEMLPSDFQSIQNSKAFFYGAETLDGWAAKINVENKIELLSLVPDNYLIDIKIPHFHSNEQAEEEVENIGVDPHFWTDPNVVRAMIPNLLKQLIRLDPASKEIFNSNAEKFTDKLIKLNEKINDETSSLKFSKVFTAHPFYSYFFERYDFKVAGSLEIAPGSQPSPRDIKNLIELVKQENVKAIFTNRQQSDKPAKVLAEASGINEYELDPMGGVEGRMNYEEIILYNLQIIKSALK